MRIGEIIATESTALVAQSYTLNRPPALGTLVEVAAHEELTIYGIVSQTSTGGIDPSRLPLRRSTDTSSDQDVYRHHPELSHTLRTEFRALLVGWSTGQGVRQSLPPAPPPLHYTVRACTPETVTEFTENAYYLRLLLQGSDPVAPEQLIIASLREAYQARGEDRTWLREAARELARLLRNDHERLMTVLYAIEPRS